MVERHYLSNNIILSIRSEKKGDQESFVAYRHDPQDGIYKVLGPGEIKADLQKIYEDFFTDKPPITLLSEMKYKVYKLTKRDGTEAIFSWDKGTVYYLPGRIRDIEVNLSTGEVRLLEKDPLNRPFLTRMPYDFSSLYDPPSGMPRELEFLKKYTTPRFFVNILAMLAKAVTMKGADIIFVNYSRVHGTGKTTLYNIFEDLFGDVVARAKVKDFQYQFFEATLVGKTLLLMEEYKGYSPTVNERLKEFASEKGKIEGSRKFKERNAKAPNTLAVVLNMNRLKINEEFLEEPAFMQRIAITPFTHVWKSEEYPRWSKEEKERIVLWVVKNLVPQFVTGKLRPTTYPRGVIREWVERYEGVPPSGVDIFLRENAYAEENARNTNAVFVPLQTAYYYYQLWCDANDYLPVTDEEFAELMHYGANEQYLFEKEGVKGIYMKKANLSFFGG